MVNGEEECMISMRCERTARIEWGSVRVWWVWRRRWRRRRKRECSLSVWMVYDTVRDDSRIEWMRGIVNGEDEWEEVYILLYSRASSTAPTPAALIVARCSLRCDPAAAETRPLVGAGELNATLLFDTAHEQLSLELQLFVESDTSP
jgi:hypothetical protein